VPIVNRQSNKMLYGIRSGSLSSESAIPNNQTFGYTEAVTWGELIRRLKAAGFVEARTGKGSHRQLVHPKTGQVITVAVHTKKEVGTGLVAKILKEAGL
jgi:predicted RNA binding protein YcfA (HicA-like mRNA interferase family)